MSAAATDQTMRALVLEGIGKLSDARIPTPPVLPGQVLVHIGFCGVCGSDIPRIFTKGTYRFPTVCGHEFAGTVEKVAPDVKEFSPGDRVAVFPLLWCGKCAACERGQYVMCHDYDYFGSRRDGAFAEYVAAPVRNLIRIPDNVSLEEAAMTEPAAVALHAVKRAGGSLIGQTAAVFGAGPIGLMVAQWCRAMGAADVLLFDIIAEKLSMAKQMGFANAFNSRTHEPVKTVEQWTSGNGAHVSIDAAGVPQTLLQAMSATRRGGRCVILGNPSGDVTISAALISQLMRREVNIVGTWNSDYSAAGNDDDWRTVLAAMSSGAIDLMPLVTHKVGLPDARAVLEMMKSQREFYSKVLIHP